MLTALEIGLRMVGVFYVLAGFLAMHGAVSDRMMDLMLSALTLEPQPAREGQRRALWTVSALAIAMGGGALMALSLWAVPLFLVGLGTQAFYLVWARTAYPPENADEEKGRRQTINAALLYAVATLGVVAAASAGLLRPWLDPWALAAPAAGLFLLFAFGRQLFWKAKSPGMAFPPDDEEDDIYYPDPGPIPVVTRVRLEPRWGCYGLIDADTDEDCQPDLYVPDELANRIHWWTMTFDGTRDTFTAVFEDREDEARHRREGDEIVAELRAVFGADNVEGPIYPSTIAYVGPDIDADGNTLKAPET
ncbi:hypothetical protein [Devosia sediminis]|uniref:Uncharacterized protein n=1 Tax=Devosia sediminis TaxID=2798801 RepID=A0A934MFU0_9HYPH|nr:hypothetical protein [Devosia sediminis]MBJ3783212.1 hypothetical protein [Devosia sediminis]